MTRSLFLLALAASLASAQAQAPSGPPAGAGKPADAPEPEPAPTTIEQVYNGAGLRDPFIPLMGAGGAGGGEADVSKLPPPNIHVLVLKGVISGKKSFALIEDSSTGARYVLRADGKLYDVTGRPVPGISGSIKSAKSVLVTTTADNDVQWLQMAE